MTITIFTGTLRTPVGDAHFATTEGGALVALGFSCQWEGLLARLSRRFDEAAFAQAPSAAPVYGAFGAYFAGDASALDSLAVDAGGTPFQRHVWAALRAIPFGTTRSYADVARAVGAPRAVRAVGAANGANPVSIVVPCHRVIGAAGALTGYAGGVERKAWLLAHERRLSVRALSGYETASSTQA